MILTLELAGIKVTNSVLDAIFFIDGTQKKVRAILAYPTDEIVATIELEANSKELTIPWYSKEDIYEINLNDWLPFNWRTLSARRYWAEYMGFATVGASIPEPLSETANGPFGIAYERMQWKLHKTKFIVAEFLEKDFFDIASNPRMLETNPELGSIQETYFSNATVSTGSVNGYPTVKLNFDYVFPYVVTRTNIIELRVQGSAEWFSIHNSPVRYVADVML